MNRTRAAALIAAMMIALSSCTSPSVPDGSQVVEDDTGYFSKVDLNAVTEVGNAVKISLEGDKASVSGKGASYSEGRISIGTAGVYHVTGALSDGQIYIDVAKDEKVTLVLDNVSMSCSKDAVIYVNCADKVILSIPEGSVCNFTDGADHGKSDASACIYSRDDLTINGRGTINVVSNYNNGIGTKNDLRIEGVTIHVSAPNNALKGNDSVRIYSGSISVKRSDDAIKASTDDDSEKGFVYIRSGELRLCARDNAIQAPNYIRAIGGSINITTGGDAINCNGSVDTSGAVITEN